MYDNDRNVLVSQFPLRGWNSQRQYGITDSPAVEIQPGPLTNTLSLGTICNYPQMLREIKPSG